MFSINGIFFTYTNISKFPISNMLSLLLINPYLFIFSGFTIKGPSQAKIDCVDNHNGSANVTYHPSVAGEYNVHILCDNEDIPGSPFIAHITPPITAKPEKVGFILKFSKNGFPSDACSSKLLTKQNELHGLL